MTLRQQKSGLKTYDINTDGVAHYGMFADWFAELSLAADERQKGLGGGKAIKAEVPLAEMFGYSTTLRSLTQGRATYTMEFKQYAEAPKNVAEAVIAARTK